MEENIMMLFHHVTLCLSRLKSLESEVKALRKEIDEKHSKSMTAIDKLTSKYLDVFQFHCASFISLVVTFILFLSEAVTAMTSAVGAPGKCKLKDLQRAVEGHDEIEVPPGKVLLECNSNTVFFFILHL